MKNTLSNYTNSFLKRCLLRFSVITVLLISIVFTGHVIAADKMLAKAIQSILDKRGNSPKIKQIDKPTTQSLDQKKVHTPERFHLVLFYMHSCIHCQRFDPILKHYADQHTIKVLAYTLDGKLLPSFPNSVYPTASEKSMYFPAGNIMVPTVFLLDNQQKSIIPVLKGEATEQQLSERMRQVFQSITSRSDNAKSTLIPQAYHSVEQVQEFNYGMD